MKQKLKIKKQSFSFPIALGTVSKAILVDKAVGYHTTISNAVMDSD